jgi:hypothetical protein
MMTASPTRTRILRVTPRAALLTVTAGAASDGGHRVTWDGAAPVVRTHDHVLEIDYALAGRLRALSPRRSSLTLALSPDATWTIELDGGVSGLRADLRELPVTAIAISGGARDVRFQLAQPPERLAIDVRGGLSEATIMRPPGVPTTLEIEGGASRVRVDEVELGAIGGPVRHRTPGEGGQIALRVGGGASGLRVVSSSAVLGR